MIEPVTRRADRASHWDVAAPAQSAGTTIWRAGTVLTDAQRRACLAVLSQEERARAGRFVRPEDRDRLIASHAALRLILADVLGARPADIAFATGEGGKPELAASWRGRLQFNLSHSGDWALVGVAPAGRIGVDVERVRPIADCLGIARHHFAAREIAALEALPAEAVQEAFYACWTRKEAFVKALGAGLSHPLDRFTVSVPPAPAALLEIDGDAGRADEWSLHHLCPAPDHVGAAVIEGRNAECRLLSLRPDWTDGLGMAET